MIKNNRPAYPVDSISILFLSLMRREHTNSFRFSMTLREPVCPEILQSSVDSLWRRLPSVVACIKPGFQNYTLQQAQQPPKVLPDPGLLKTMTREELETCAFRVYYRENTISIEVFHVLTDGGGAIMTLITLVSDYLQRKHGIQVPISQLRLDMEAPPAPEETEDSFLSLAEAKPWHLPSRFSYLPPRPEDTDWRTRSVQLRLETRQLLDAAHRHGVTLNTLLSAVLASCVMQMQLRRNPRKLKPVRIMVPADLRKLFGSRTMRNFALYALPTMEPEHSNWDLSRLCQSFGEQIKSHFSREKLASMSSYNVRTQNGWYFRYLPWKMKAMLMRIGYRFFGESNSSLTLTNLGNIRLPEEIAPHVADMQLFMTPRAGVPYGCTVLSLDDHITITLSKFTDDTELEDLFFGALKAL